MSAASKRRRRKRRRRRRKKERKEGRKKERQEKQINKQEGWVDRRQRKGRRGVVKKQNISIFVIKRRFIRYDWFTEYIVIVFLWLAAWLTVESDNLVKLNIIIQFWKKSMTFYINLGTDHNKRISIRLLQDTSTALSAMKASNTGPPSPPPTSKKHSVKHKRSLMSSDSLTLFLSQLMTQKNAEERNPTRSKEWLEVLDTTSN